VITTTTVVPRVPAEIAKAIMLPDGYADIERVVHPACAWLRANMPVGLAEIDGYDPIWLVAKHAQIREVFRDANLFHSADVNIMLHPRAGDDYLRGLLGGTTRVLDTLSYMEPPEHTQVRGAIGASFQPTEIRKFEARFREIAKVAVDRLMDHDGECDAVAALTRDYPLHAVLEMLGIPESDYGHMLKITQDTFGGDDPDWKRDDTPATPEAAAKQWHAAVQDAYEYFEVIRKDRTAHPRDDLATAIFTARLPNGEPLPERVQNHLAVTIGIAGHDTTNSALAGGLLGLARFPAELARVQADPLLGSGLVDESLRYSTPAKHFMRNATRLTEFHGVTLQPMDRIMGLFVSGNRDEEVFPDPERFDVTRKLNLHLSFSYGPHACLGQHLAKIEMRALFDELLPRIKSLELAGTPTLKRGNFVTGLKTLPIRFTKA
jgi:cytochrome P450